MSRSWSKVLAGLLVTLSFAAITLGQTTSKTGAKYDISREVKLKGRVTEVRDATAPTEATVLVVKTAEGPVTVQLAPRDYLKEIDCWIKVGDQVEVTGAKVGDSTDQIIAREVVFGNSTMVLRDGKGTPIWELWKPAKSGG
jgi:hypothetical protein